MRKFGVQRSSVLLAAFCFVLAGCGGGGGGPYGGGGGGGGSVGYGVVSGVVYDQNGNVVRNAQISYSGGSAQTTSNSKGAYILSSIPATTQVIECSLTSNGVSYLGENVAELTAGARTMTINIALYPSTQLASLTGTVTDLNGNGVPGASLYLIPASGKLLNSAYGISDNNGNYFIGGLLAGTTYNVQVNSAGYNSSIGTQTFTAGQTATVNYSLPPATNTTLAAPTNVTATAYTAPLQATSDAVYRKALAAIKHVLHPAQVIRPIVRKQIQTGSFASAIEIDVAWTPTTNTSLLGYAIYRGTGTQTLNNIDFMYDPLGSVYEDMSASLTSNQSYSYAVSTVSTSYNGTTGQSALSNTATATPLPELSLNAPVASANPTVNWTPVAGATSYTVYFFSSYPDIGATPLIANPPALPAGSSSYTWSGAALTSGQTYYYLVLGNGTGSETVSLVGSVTVP